MSEKKNWIWKLLFGIFLAAAVIGVVVTCLQIRNRILRIVQIELQQVGKCRILGFEAIVIHIGHVV